MIERLTAFIARAAAWLFLAAAVCAVFEVVLRYGFRAPTVWAGEVTIALCACGYFLAGAEAMRRRAHIRIGIFYDNAPQGRRFAIDVLTVVVGLVFLAGLGWGAWQQFVESAWKFDGAAWQPETTGRAWDVPLPPAIRLVFVFGVVLFGLALVASLRRLPARERD